MNIIVCAKQIRHTYARTGLSPETRYIDPEDSVFRVNPHDEAALELALRIKERIKEEYRNTTVLLLTLGPMIAEAEMRWCMAVGADALYQVSVPGQTPAMDPLDQPDPWVKSDLLARAAKELAGDLILCGRESLDTGNAQVGGFLAHRLDRPYVSAITDLTVNGKTGTAQVERSAGRGIREIVECRLPAVFSVDLGPELRLPKFDGRKKAETSVIRHLDVGTDVDGPKLVRTRRFQARPRPRLIPVPDSRMDAYDRVTALLSGSTVEKKGEILTGSPETQVEGIIAFLKAGHFLGTNRADR